MDQEKWKLMRTTFNFDSTLASKIPLKSIEVKDVLVKF